MILLDSNIIIYAIKPEYPKVRELISKNDPFISAISYLEVLGYHKLTQEDKQDFKDLFEFVSIIPISQTIIEKAVELRQNRKMSLGDSVIAATAITHSFLLLTANIKDFFKIDRLRVMNPVNI